MADSNPADLLMVIKPKGKIALEGEATTVYDTNDSTMMENFLPNRFCEIDTFTLGAGIEDDSGSDMSDDSGFGGGSADNELHVPRGRGSPKGEKRGKSGGSGHKKGAKYRRFLETGVPQGGQDGLGYDVTLNEVTVERFMDRMSMQLLQLCLNQKPLDYIIIVKRKFTGNRQFHEAYLRYKFTDVLLTSIDWQDGESVKETLKFVYREVESAYKPQKADGSLASAVSASFSYVATTK
ncbi:MAG: type VI secretion system tube protein Hcp [Rhodospirillales bacterium]|nr:type VI secretion system tube protein Hcp [Rhodospirillales bacterium]